MQAAKQAGRSLEFMKLSHNLAAVQRKKLDKIEAAYEIYQVRHLILQCDIIVLAACCHQTSLLRSQSCFL